uniref:Uncharacterized protein n=1 Tax=Vespula pensylvanica TaxID=30213 RepID=A0A834NSR6_VESPE|nr:hypothetical protein H0235_011807 [Vespula pensylvanica]
MIKNAETIAEQDNNENGKKRNIPTSSEMEATHLRTDSPARSETHENEDNEAFFLAFMLFVQLPCHSRQRYPHKGSLSNRSAIFLNVNGQLSSKKHRIGVFNRAKAIVLHCDEYFLLLSRPPKDERKNDEKADALIRNFHHGKIKGAARYPRLLDFPSSLGNLFNLTGHEMGETLPLESHASERVMVANFIPKYTNRRQLAMQVELPQADHQTLVYVGYLGD